MYNSYFDFAEYATKGHYFDLDMLDFGTCRLNTLGRTLTKDEMIMEFSMRAFLCSPIQISSTLEDVDEFELSVYCNEEILALNQDCAFGRPQLVLDDETYKLHIWEKRTEDGSYAYAIFNLGKGDSQIEISANGKIRDLWAKEDIAENSSTVISYSHTAKMFKSRNKCEFTVK